MSSQPPPQTCKYSLVFTIQGGFLGYSASFNKSTAAFYMRVFRKIKALPSFELVNDRILSRTCCCDGDLGADESLPLSSSSEILNSRSSVYLFLFTWRLERRFCGTERERAHHKRFPVSRTFAERSGESQAEQRDGFTFSATRQRFKHTL